MHLSGSQNACKIDPPMSHHVGNIVYSACLVLGIACCRVEAICIVRQFSGVLTITVLGP